MSGKKVLLEVDIKMTQAIRELGELRERMDDVRSAQREVDRSSKEGQAEYARLGIELGVLKKEYVNLEKSVSGTIRLDRAKEGSLEALRLELSNLNAEYVRLSRTEREAVSGQELQRRIKQLSDEIRGQEETLGDWRRNVGHYERATAALKGELADLLDVLKNVKGGGSILASTQSSLSQQASELEQRISSVELAIRSTGDTQSEETQRMTAELAVLKERLGEVYGELEQIGESQSADWLSDSSKAIADSLSMIAASMAVGSKEGEEYAAVIKTLAKVSAALQAIQAQSEATRKKSVVTVAAINLLQKIGIDQTKAQTKAEASLNTLRGKGNVVTKAAAAVQWAWNAALAANPVMAVVVAVAALIAGIRMLVSWLGESESATERAEKAQATYEQQCRRTALAVDEANLAEIERSAKLASKYQEEIRTLMACGATKEVIARKEQEFANATAESEIQGIQDRMGAEEEAVRRAEAYYRQLAGGIEQARKEAQGVFSFDQEGFDAYMERVEDAKKAWVGAKTTFVQSSKELADKQFDVERANYDRSIEENARYYERLQKRVEAHHNFEKRQLELSSIYLYDYSKTAEENAEARFVAEQRYALESFALEQKQAREKLKAQKMTAAERLEAEANLRKQQEQEQAIFTARQLEAMRAHQRELLQAAVDLAGGKDLDGRIEDVRAKYAAAAKSIREDTTMEADERAFYERRLAQREAEEIKQLRLSADEETNKRILEQTEELYRNDVRQFSASNAERIQLEIDKQKRIIAARKAAGLDTLAEERQLVAKEAELRAAALDSSLRLAWNNADEQYRIKREYIERELEAEELSAERRAELEEELTTLTVENNQRKVASIEQWAGAAMDMASGVNDLMNALGDREVQKAEEKNDREKKALDKRLKAGVISQKDYDKQVAALDADLDAKKKKIAVEQAKREKALKAMQVAVDTAVAIMQLWVNPGFPAAIPMAAVVGALGAVQLATVLATPIPVARRGGRIEGATHEQGGVLVNTENEERIISSAPAKAFPELLNLISYIGKHGGGVPETGYAARMAAAARPGATRGGMSEIDYDLLADKVGARVGERVGEEIRSLRVYLSLTELKEAEREYARIEESAKL